MHRSAVFAILVISLAFTPGTQRAKLPVSQPNPNTAPSGRLANGVLALSLEARLTLWHPDGDSLPGIAIEAFGEPGRAPQVPGPLIRVPFGTELRISVKNSLETDTLTYYVETGSAPDTIVVAPGAIGELRVRPARAGNFLYRATTSTVLGRALRAGGLLAGAVVIDTLGATGAARDRVFVIQVAADDQFPNSGIPRYQQSVWAINGRSWPHNERLDATVGDTVRWRLINATSDLHPMHLHGFYYMVDAVELRGLAAATNTTLGRPVVTERMTAFSTMSMSWVPERAENWLFHCHFADHLVPHGALGGESPAEGVARIAPWPPHATHSATENHALTGMAGLVMGVVVRPRPGERIPAPVVTRRQLRLVAIQDREFPDSEPSLRFVLEDRRNPTVRVEAWPGLSAPISLVKGEPVSITVVNNLREPTAVHWHGIELDSYFDGVAGFSGVAQRLSPIIAPRDSFEARFTPPRSGTFIYHSHVDELRQHKAGLVGSLIVRDGVLADSSTELTFLFKSARYRNAVGPFEINGQLNPDTVRLRVGQRYRLRLISIHAGLPSLTVSITARADSVRGNAPDSFIVQWTPVAKDGADLPVGDRTPRLARLGISMGETYDFEFTPDKAGNLRLELRAGGRMVVRTPIRVD